MKGYNIKTTAAIVLTLLFIGCSDILEETPRSTYTSVYFNSEKGLIGGVNSLYAHLRNIYGNGFYYSGMQGGTDESTWGAVNGNDARNADFSGAGVLNSQNNPFAAIWGVFPNINTANGIIQSGEAVGIAPSIVAEARFMRAFDYFLLVQTFGGVPLDLGSGELKQNISPIRFSVRNTVPEVYTRAIFPDLVKAVTDLPARSRVTGSANKTLAQLYLAKAYLTYGWWLQNPNNIPTYPTASRTDPDGNNAAFYFQKAYDVATEAINTHDASIGLESYFYDVHLGSNDRNKEMLLYADHTQSSDLFNGSPVNEFGPAASPGSFSHWYANWNYTNIRSLNAANASVSSVQREAVQAHGRPFTGVAPTREAIMNIFSDKTNDSRYDGTFVTVYRGNWKRGTISDNTLFNANGLPVAMEDPILTILDTDPGTIVYPTGAGTSNVGAGSIPGRADWILVAENTSRIWYPGPWKLGPYRTDNGTSLGQASARLTRPFPIAKFSELYFVAAEAAVKGATPQAGKSARDLINVIRARAGMWRWKNNDRVAFIADYSAAMVAATPAVVDINYILDELSREYYGEGIRWFDLVRTQTWSARAATFTICGVNFGDRTPVVYTRNIPLTAYLRPIPQGQLDGMEMSAEEKAAYQNPGY
ncbi:MAG: RagB/SusD family nutrient uptake outer membrane protein [Cyclobacteriaceae bacterium]|nr:RagB/SusD family nutrient uptake outer membrane protein [Cyclobacteriaceae bacterium]